MTKQIEKLGPLYLFDGRQDRGKGQVKALDLSDPPQTHTDVEHSTS